MVYLVSLFALGAAGMSLLLLYWGTGRLLVNWRALRHWRRVQGRVIAIEERLVVTTGPSRSAGGYGAQHSWSGVSTRYEKVYIPTYEYAVPNGGRATVVSGTVGSAPDEYAIGDTDELWVDPQGIEPPLVNRRGGIWFMPLGMLVASVCAAIAAAAAGYMVARQLGPLGQ